MGNRFTAWISAFVGLLLPLAVTAVTVPGMYQKLYSGANVSTGDPADGGVIIASGARFTALAGANPSLTFVDEATGTSYKMGEQTTAGYRGYMMMSAGVAYTFVKNFDDNGHIRVVSPSGAETLVVTSTDWQQCKFGTYTPSVTGWHKVTLYVGNGGGGIGPTDAVFDSIPASMLWNNVGLTSVTEANKTQWHRFLNDGTEGTYLYTDRPPDSCTLTIPAKTGLVLESVKTNNVEVVASGDDYKVDFNTRVTIRFVAAENYEILSGNPVILTVTDSKTMSDDEYPKVRYAGPVVSGWTTSVPSSTVGLLRLDGALLYSYAPVALTLNGLAFTADASVSSGSFSFSPAMWETSSGLGDGGLSGDWANLNKNGWIWGSSVNSVNVTLNGLAAGNQYLVQILSHNGGSSVKIGTTSADLVLTSGSCGASVVGVFTATAASHTFTLAFGGDSGNRSINAIQVRDFGPVPRPERLSYTMGKNFEVLGITGESAASSVTVKLRDRYDVTKVIPPQTVSVSGGKFSATFASLSRGHVYSVFVDDVELGAVSMSRECSVGWLRENATSFVQGGATGVWGGDGSAAASDGRIVISTESEGEDKTSVVFTHKGGNPSDNRYRVDGRFRFEGEAEVPLYAEGIFGVMLAQHLADTRTVFYIVDEMYWIPTEVEGVPGTDYDVCFFVDEENRRVDYYLVTDTGYTYLDWGAIPYDESPRFKTVSFEGDGSVVTLVGETRDTTLFTLAVDTDTAISTNFTAIGVSGKVRLTKVWDTDITSGRLRVVVRDRTGREVASKEFDFAGDLTPIEMFLDGLAPGSVYDLTAELVEGDGGRVEDGQGEEIVTAKEYSGRWIDENSDTFDGKAEGTGSWSYSVSSTPEAETGNDAVLGSVVKINTLIGSGVTFTSTNEEATVLNASVRELTVQLLMDEVGYYVSQPRFPTMRLADIAGVTIACDDTDNCAMRFSVYNPGGSGSWNIVPGSVAALGTAYTINVRITYPNPQRSLPALIEYYLVNEGVRETLAIIEPAPKTDGSKSVREVDITYRTQVRFTGSGCFKTLTGDCADAHLATVEGTEYWTVAEAVRSIRDTGRVLSPLWRSTCVVDAQSGRFGVYDPEGLLTIVWPYGYVVTVTDDGDIRYYLFRVSDYWIDWADEAGVVKKSGGWEVLDAHGLAWLARESTNAWLKGDIKLKADITNLNDHVWVPIRGFTGTFDGGNRKIVGLTDKGVPFAWTNSLPMSVYGLFGSASNSVFRGVSFEDVAITNAADAVAALLGCSLGDVAVTNVIVRSGDITGGGRYVAGLVGYVGDFGRVSFSRNVNAAAVTSVNDPLGGANAAGVANLGKSVGEGAVAVVNNENRGALATTINSTVGGGNVAQILAGSSELARFTPAQVKVTDNVGTGDVSKVASLNHDGSDFAALPVVNLAAVVSEQSEEGYREFIEANDSSDVLIDPYRKTARMTRGLYQDGATNFAGRITDRITASLPGATLDLTESLELWSPIIADRPITLALGGNILDMVFDDYLFDISPSVTLTVQNGTISFPAGKRETGGGTLNAVSVSEKPWNCEYWERTLLINGEFFSLVSLPMLKQALSEGAAIAVPEESAYSIDAEKGTLKTGDDDYVSFSELGYSVRAEKDGEDTVYIVEIADEPETPPEINLALTPNGGTSKVVIKGTKAGLTYRLESVANLAEKWQTVEEQTAVSDGEGLEFKVDTSAPSGFFRIKVIVK